ncbi:MAG: AlkA N-terminal domain-containing protein, partial [Acidimicrobiia bacterium]
MTGDDMTEGGGVTGGGGDSKQFELDVRPPFRLDLTAWVLRRRPDNHVDKWDGTTYQRVLRVDGTPIDVAVTQRGTDDRPRLAVTLTAAAAASAASRARREVTARLQRMLGLDLDTAAFIQHVSSDPAIGPLARRFSGVKPPRFPTVFECLVNSIACQQLTLTFGIQLLDRLACAHGPRTPTGANGGGFGFPEPSDLAHVEPDAFRALGFSHAKARAIIELAQRVTGGALDLDGFDRLDDAAAAAQLLGLRGIGRWSAEYALLRGLG